jgi:hypothetical protein
MIRSQTQSRQSVQTLGIHLWLAFTACALMTVAAVDASAQLADNQTNGFGNNRLVTFTYLQNFDCVDQPTLDLDFNGKLAQSDPNEMQFASQLPNPPRTRLAETSNTPHIFTCSFQCSRLTTTRMLTMPCHVRVVEGLVSSAVRRWGRH